MKMTADQFRAETRGAYPGYCTECDDITHFSAEPDAQNHYCEECENNTVFGLEMAMIMELIEIVD